MEVLVVDPTFCLIYSNDIVFEYGCIYNIILVQGYVVAIILLLCSYGETPKCYDEFIPTVSADNDVKKAVKPIEDLWDDCKSAGSSIAKTLFGWL